VQAGGFKNYKEKSMAMQAKFVQDGIVVPVVISAQKIPGDVVVVGKRVGVVVAGKTTAEIAAGDTIASVQMHGVFNLPLVGSLAVADGEALYWDADGNPYGGTQGTGCVTKTSTDVFCGYAVGLSGSNAGSVNCDLASKDGVDLT